MKVRWLVAVTIGIIILLFTTAAYAHVVQQPATTLFDQLVHVITSPHHLAVLLVVGCCVKWLGAHFTKPPERK